MSTEEIIRTWKDPEYRIERIDLAPDHPAGQIELADQGLENGAADQLFAGTFVQRHSVCTFCVTHRCL